MTLKRTIVVTLEAPNHDIMVEAMEAFAKDIIDSDIDTFDGEQKITAKTGFTVHSKWTTWETTPTTPTAHLEPADAAIYRRMEGNMGRLMADISNCVVCEKKLRPDRARADTCGARCYKKLVQVQRAVNESIEKNGVR